MSCLLKCQTVVNRRNMEEEKLHFSGFMQLAVHILYNETNLPLMHHIKIESRIGCKYFVFFSRGQNHLKSILTSQRRETIFNDHTRGWLSTKTWIKICSNGRISNQLSTTTHNVGVLGSSYKGNIRRANNYQLKKCY